MNNNAAAILRALIVYAICVPLAIWVGYLLTSVADFSSRGSFIYAGIFVLVLCIPLLLRWHHILLVFCWNLAVIVFFLPGKPNVWLPMVVLSLTISVLQRALNKDMHFIRAPQITWPFLVLVAVVIGTAKLTGGIGLKSLGSDVEGGKKYVTLLVGILGYFALTARRIPVHQAGLYVGLFFLGGCFSVIGDFISFVPSAISFIFWFFPPNSYAFGGGGDANLRFAGLCVASSAVFSFMLAKYGIRGIFLSGKLWRPFFFMLFSTCLLFGGFRSAVIACVMLFVIQFYLEGLHRTNLLPVFLFFGFLLAVAIVPLANKLPYTFQRSLAFLPLNISSDARLDAQGSEDWRLEIWKAEVPEIPAHLLLGKGYALTQADLDSATASFHAISAEDWGSAVAGDYHSGPLSVILPFGIWGVIALLWLMSAGGWALYNNYRHGDPALRTVNSLLFASLLTNIFCYMFIFGALENETQTLGGLLGLSVALNGGICRQTAKSAATIAGSKIQTFAQPRLQPALQR
jgi:hypothetical protein